MTTTVFGAQGVCEDCGFDPAGLAPGDAATAARSFARRWRELLDGVAEREEGGEMLLRQRSATGWSALERAGHVATTLEHGSEVLLQVWEHERPALDEAGSADTGRSLALQADRGVLLARLSAAAERLARVIERYEGPDWARTGLRAGQPISAWELATQVVHEASHHLRACRHELAAVCTHSIESEAES